MIKIFYIKWYTSFFVAVLLRHISVAPERYYVVLQQPINGLSLVEHKDKIREEIEGRRTKQFADKAQG